MIKVWFYSILLVAGLIVSHFLPGAFGAHYGAARVVIQFFTMTALAFIMIHVGLEFDIDKKNIRGYVRDYLIAATAAAFPWIFCALYFIFVMHAPDRWYLWTTWIDSLVVGRFASPTSAGILFAMLAAAGVAGTWTFRKMRILAVFDDLDTILFMIPLTAAMVGLNWQLVVVAVVVLGLIGLAWRFLHMVRISTAWTRLLAYSLLIAFVSEFIYFSTKKVFAVPLHLEVLPPAFTLGCIIAREKGGTLHKAAGDERAYTVISSAFMLLVGLSMPPVITQLSGRNAFNWRTVALHVLIITVLSNIGKMFPALCYKKEASIRERLAVSIGMFPRGEVGAGVLVISLSLAITGPIVTIAALSLALNLVLTGLFIYIVKRLLHEDGVPRKSPARYA